MSQPAKGTWSFQADRGLTSFGDSREALETKGVDKNSWGMLEVTSGSLMSSSDIPHAANGELSRQGAVHRHCARCRYGGRDGVSRRAAGDRHSRESRRSRSALLRQICMSHTRWREPARRRSSQKPCAEVDHVRPPGSRAIRQNDRQCRHAKDSHGPLGAVSHGETDSLRSRGAQPYQTSAPATPWRSRSPASGSLSSNDLSAKSCCLFSDYRQL